MADSQHHLPDLWLALETKDDGRAKLRPIIYPVNRRQSDTESQSATKFSSDSGSPLSELDEEALAAETACSLPLPALKPKRTADVTMRDVFHDIPMLAQDELKQKHSARALTHDSDALTEIDDAIKHDGVSPPSTQLVTTPQHFLDPHAPRVSYEPSESTGLFEIREQPSMASQSPPSLTFSPIRSAGRWKINKYRGPANCFPAHLLQVLDEWHEENPLEAPPCHWKGRTEGTQKWENFRVFDQEADEHEVSIFKITVTRPKYRTYNLMILHSDNAPEVFVDCATHCRPTNMRGTGFQGHYVVAWLGLTKGYENDNCAIWVWAPEGTEIPFNSGWFDKRPRSMKIEKGSSPITPARTTPRHPATFHHSDPDNMLTQYSEKQSVQHVWVEEGVVAPSRVRQNLSPITSIRFKLLSDTSPNVRIFSFNDRIDSTDIFKKAREFYQDVEISRKLALLCKVPGQEELRYIGEGCADEFDILCDDIKRLSLYKDEVCVVEMKPAVPLKLASQ
ncbi:uncharacterized protein N7484_007488 [Penicillium longicatenatum]|uniref:uncharacterized protein n=1 Tax=Penicillium longicatenatum TaxID=1561947 RepID=UPI0025493E9C|nr:uncharacterized protein N7484_007488 [Penicillium longicatenatum]KAJ5639626.1 hypothetical protein N7484_007488 [Penicillium longicatenatum]